MNAATSTTMTASPVRLPQPSYEVGNPEEALSRDAEGHPINFFYDMPCFVSPDFTHAAGAVDFWSGQLANDIAAEHREQAARRARGTADEVLEALNLYQPSFGLSLAENWIAHVAIQEVLTHTACEIHRLAPADRGHYLAQLLTRWFSDGQIDPFRFRLGHLSAVYVAAMPSEAQCLGPVKATSKDGEELTVIAWRTNHGLYLDLVHVLRPIPDYLDAEITAVLDAGNKTFGPTVFAGVRYLPLDDLTRARLYTPDGGYLASVSERDLPERK